MAAYHAANAFVAIVKRTLCSAIMGDPRDTTVRFISLRASIQLLDLTPASADYRSEEL